VVVGGLGSEDRVRGLLMFRYRNYSDRRTDKETCWKKEKKKKERESLERRGIICQIGEETQTQREKGSYFLGANVIFLPSFFLFLFRVLLLC
jgi:hypothetical protein